jgi:hypothetical protein
MKSFIRVVELWVPDEARTVLEYGGGLYGEELHEFREISEHGLAAAQVHRAFQWWSDHLAVRCAAADGDAG